MPYPVTANALAKIQSRSNVAATIGVVLTSPDGAILKYSTIEIFGCKRGLIPNSNLYEQFNGNGQGGTLKLEIFDYDGELLNLLHSDNVIGWTVDYYVIFEDLTEADVVLVYSGTLDIPFTWSENTRRVSFNVLSSNVKGVIKGPAVIGWVKGVKIQESLEDLAITSPLSVITQNKKKRGVANGTFITSRATLNMSVPPEIQFVNGVDNSEGCTTQTMWIGGCKCVMAFVEADEIEGSINVSEGVIGMSARDMDDMDANNPSVLFASVAGLDIWNGKYIKLKVKTETYVYVADAAPENVEASVFGYNTFLIDENHPILKTQDWIPGVSINEPFSATDYDWSGYLPKDIFSGGNCVIRR